MSQKGDSKVSAEKKDVITVILTAKTYHDWIEDAELVCGIKYGRIADVLKTGIPYVEPKPKSAQYLPALGPGDSPLSAALKEKLKERAYDRYHTRLDEVVKDKVKMYFDLMSSVGTESLIMIKTHADYLIECERNRNSDALVAIVASTHHNEIGGNIELRKHFMREKKEIEFGHFKMTSEMDLSSFYKQFVEFRATLTKQGHPVPEDRREAQKFLQRLDDRYSDMMISMANGTLVGVRYPGSLAAAYETASMYIVPAEKLKKPAAASTSTYLANEENTTRVGNRGGRGTATGGRGAGGRGGGRGGRGPAAKKGSPPPNKHLKKAVRFKEEKGNKTTGKIDMTGWVVPAGCEPVSKTCRGCLKKGHIWIDCPDNVEKVLVGKEDGEDDWEEEEDDYSTFVIARDSNRDQERALFLNDEILLDNQASQCIFHNESLLHGVIGRDPYNMCGIDGAQSGLRVDRTGEIRGFGRIGATVGLAEKASANILAQARLIDAGYGVRYDGVRDQYEVDTDSKPMTFTRKVKRGGKRSPHYTHVIERAYVETVAGNKARFTRREGEAAEAGKELLSKFAHGSWKGVTDQVERGIKNLPIAGADMRRAKTIWKLTEASMKGKTNRQKQLIVTPDLSVRVTQVQQSLAVDIMFVFGMPILLGLLTPLALIQVYDLDDDRGAASVARGLNKFISTARGRGFDTKYIRTDGEGAIAALKEDLEKDHSLVVDTTGSGTHVEEVERMSQTLKKRVRCHFHDLPFVMGKAMLKKNVVFCARGINMVASSTSTDKTSPYEQFTGRKLDAKIDLRVAYGDYVQAINPKKDNQVANANTHGCVAVRQTGSLTGSVEMWRISTQRFVKRDQFTVLPMPDEVISLLDKIAEKDGITRGTALFGERKQDPDVGKDTMPTLVEDDSDDDDDVDDKGPTMKTVPPDRRSEGVNSVDIDDVEEGEDANDTEPEVNCESDLQYNETRTGERGPENQDGWVRRSARLARQIGLVIQTGPARKMSTACQLRDKPILVESLSKRLSEQDCDSARRAIRWELERRSQWHDTQYAFKMSVKAAMRDRPKEALPVIEAELRQMHDKTVWHGVHMRNLTKAQRRAIIRSSMFLKDKYFASGAFEKFKARLVAGGDQQDRTMYEDLSAPTAATANVFAMAALAARERRRVATVDIGGAYLNASMEESGVIVHMRLDKVMTGILVKIDPKFAEFVGEDGSSVVQLDKALYGCVEAAHLWYLMLREKLEAYGFEANPAEPCVFNKHNAAGVQISLTLHVDDLMTTCTSEAEIDLFFSYLRTQFPVITVHKGKTLSYLGMLFDFREEGAVYVTMQGTVDDTLEGCGVDRSYATPATDNLFVIRDAPKVTEKEAVWCRSYVAKVLYIAKRVKPECLTAVSFLTSRVGAYDTDDLGKVKRLLGYIRKTRTAGVCFRIGSDLIIRVYVDAAYGVHIHDGKSHSGAYTVLGVGGPLEAKSGKQKNVTKSSTEAELVALSDHAGRGINLRNFLAGQGYGIVPVIIYQDNLSCMAIMARGGPTSERSRHINIRYFWLCERIKLGEVTLVHRATSLMYANVLTKPLQGKQFVTERDGITNWTEDRASAVEST